MTPRTIVRVVRRIVEATAEEWRRTNDIAAGAKRLHESWRKHMGTRRTDAD